jgi:hypothetical protein
MQARGWRSKARYLAIALGTLTALVLAGGAGWPHH